MEGERWTVRGSTVQHPMGEICLTEKLSQAGEPVVRHKNRKTEVPLSIRARRKKAFTGIKSLYEVWNKVTIL